jgi:hypothetical protein
LDTGVGQPQLAKPTGLIKAIEVYRKQTCRDIKLKLSEP